MMLDKSTPDAERDDSSSLCESSSSFLDRRLSHGASSVGSNRRRRRCGTRRFSSRRRIGGSFRDPKFGLSVVVCIICISLRRRKHHQWDLEADAKALQSLKPDLVLFTGDFGEENVDVVRNVANLEFAKAVILGNHDSWYTQQFSSTRKDNVQLQLEFLGEEHVAYQRLDFPLLKLSVVGGRPFSCGGDRLFRKKLLSTRFGVDDMDQSTRRICNAASGAPEDHSIIFLAHNGPTGLGSDIDDICGKDWLYEGGDNGDPDLTAALSKLKDGTELQIPLVVFGHMHKELAYGKGLRKMIVQGDDGIIYLNGAIVPRVRPVTSDRNDGQSTTDGGFPSNAPEPDLAGTTRAFTVVDISDKRVIKIAEIWVSVIGETTKLEEEHVIFTS